MSEVGASYWLKLLGWAILAVVVFFGFRFLMHNQTGIGEYLFDSSKPLSRRIALFVAMVAFVYLTMVVLSLWKGPKNL